VILWLIGAILIIVVIVGAWWPVHKADVQARQAASLKGAWEARSLTLRPDGCLDLRTDGGRRSFIFVGKAWRECPKGKK
jgi:hypothetical protein